MQLAPAALRQVTLCCLNSQSHDVARQRLSDAVESLTLGLNWWSWPDSETAPVKALERVRRRG
jgi:hypothetical protein